MIGTSQLWASLSAVIIILSMWTQLIRGLVPTADPHCLYRRCFPFLLSHRLTLTNVREQLYSPNDGTFLDLPSGKWLLWTESRPPRFIYWSPNPPVWLYLEMHPLRQLSESQEESPHQSSNPAGPWSWPSQPPELEKINFCGLSHTVWGIMSWKPELSDTVASRGEEDISHFSTEQALTARRDCERRLPGRGAGRFH